MQEQFRKIVNDLGLEVVERRTNRFGRGLDATVQTDLFVRDSNMLVKVQRVGAQQRIKRALEADAAPDSSSRRSSFRRQVSAFLAQAVSQFSLLPYPLCVS
jgi:hypothetical protein